MQPDFQDTIPTYEKLGFNQYLEKPFSVNAGQAQVGGFNNLNFDQVQTSGSLGDKIQIGSVLIDGQNGRIIVNDGNTDRIIIGEL
jgi:hypothetical protein